MDGGVKKIGTHRPQPRRVHPQAIAMHSPTARWGGRGGRGRANRSRGCMPQAHAHRSSSRGHRFFLVWRRCRAPSGTRPTPSLLLVIDLDFDVGRKHGVLFDRSKGWMLTGGGHCFPNPSQHTSTEAVAGPLLSVVGKSGTTAAGVLILLRGCWEPAARHGNGG